MKSTIKYLVACSCGNDSIALLQFMQENKEGMFQVVYNDTGWAREDWPARVIMVSTWCFNRGITFHVTQSEGMENLVMRKKGWPMPASEMQWCTSELKEKPTNKLLSLIDPDCDLVIVTGRRREESQNRSGLPQYQYESTKHGGRDVWNPMYKHNKGMRDALIIRAGFTPLDHSSMECYPCCCANKKDLSLMSETESRVTQIKRIELSLGHTKKGKPRVMFRPYRVGGGVGIQQAIQWGKGGRGWKSPFYPKEYIFYGFAGEESHQDLVYDMTESRPQCSGGFCGGDDK